MKIAKLKSYSIFIHCQRRPNCPNVTAKLLTGTFTHKQSIRRRLCVWNHIQIFGKSSKVIKDDFGVKKFYFSPVLVVFRLADPISRFCTFLLRSVYFVENGGVI